jgi:hypothetical protein
MDLNEDGAQEPDREETKVATPDVRKETLLTPPPSHASVASGPTKTSHPGLFTPLFKMPSTPASATPASRHVRAGTADSRASTLPTLAQFQRGGFVASAHGNTTQVRKRALIHELSSDDEGGSDDEYEPSDSDSPTLLTPTKDAKDAHVLKKAKVTHGAAVSSKPQSTITAKNPFGFKQKITAKPKVSTPLTPKASTPAASLPKPAPARATPAPKKSAKKPLFQPGKRRAAQAAESRIQSLYETESHYNTESAIEEADHIEEPRLPVEGLRRMSLTPAPSEGQEAAEFGVDAARTQTNAKDNTWTKWTHTRAGGDRVPNLQATVEDADDDSEAEISEFIYVDGVIVRKDQVQELGLTSGLQDMRAGASGRVRGREKGKGYWERVKEGVREGCRMS